ncbi:MAG: hypothetical protein HC837_16725 [Chloroflexaceae bacterium]|nr:hypothetical protein [Chloroflexaceae bacterium]
MVGTLLSYHPYYLAYYSPAIGGSAHAAELVPIGWGEGLDVVADWLNQQPDLADGAVATWSPPTMRPYLQTDVAWQGDVQKGTVNYLAVYINQVQSGKDNHYFHHIHPSCTPRQTITLRGITYAWIYRLPLYAILTSEANLNQQVILSQPVLLPPDPCHCTPLTLTLTLQPQVSTPPAHTLLFLHVVGSDGTMVAQLDLALDQLLPADVWQRGEAFAHTLQLPLDASTPPGRYHIVLGLYDLTTGERLPVGQQQPAFPLTPGSSPTGGEGSHVGPYGPGSVLLATFERLPEHTIACSK